ncbi:MAG TPA: hypothetical protein ACFCUC_16495, partial [Desulfobacterales bacterium]
MAPKKEIHPWIPELKNQFANGKISRREFIRYAALLGMSAAAAMQMVGLAWPKKAFAQKVQRGGVIRVASSVQKVTHPAQFSWVEPTNILRQVAEYLTYTDKDNITHPYLLENWQASDDLKTWKLNLRKGI